MFRKCNCYKSDIKYNKGQSAYLFFVTIDVSFQLAIMLGIAHDY